MDARIVDGRKIARVTDDGKLKVLVHGRDLDGKAKVINVDENGNVKVQQVGTLPVIYISRLEDRPSASEVEIGQFVILTDEELPTWVSNGVNWVEVL